jgi:hypothetical protein
MIDPDRIGIVGVSWGGVVSSTTIGLDYRLAFAVSGYGCGSMSRSKNHIGAQIRDGGNGKAGNATYYDSVWDPILRFSEVHIPTMWFSFPQEIRFPLPEHATTYKSLSALSMSSNSNSNDDNKNNKKAPMIMTTYIPELGHGAKRIWQREESYEFAKSVLRRSEHG